MVRMTRPLVALIVCVRCIIAHSFARSMIIDGWLNRSSNLVPGALQTLSLAFGERAPRMYVDRTALKLPQSFMTDRKVNLHHGFVLSEEEERWKDEILSQPLTHVHLTRLRVSQTTIK
jgi:hypothetical protein